MEGKRISTTKRVHEKVLSHVFGSRPSMPQKHLHFHVNVQSDNLRPKNTAK